MAKRIVPYLFGPLVPLELVTTARRARHFWVRALYALVFLFVLWINYEGSFSWRGAGRELSINDLVDFAIAFFHTFAVVQFTAVLLLTPAYVAPCLPDEKERRTLEYLFTTDLRNQEIVLGKFTVRLAHIFMYILVGVPILSLMRWFGGIDNKLLIQMYLLTGLSALATAAGSMLASVYTRRVRDAVVLVYLLGTLLLAAPLLTEFVLTIPWGSSRLSPLRPVLQIVNDQLLLLNPYWVWGQSVVIGPVLGTWSGWNLLGRSAVNLSGLTLVCLVWSGLRVRRVGLRQLFGAPRMWRWQRRPRLPIAAWILRVIGLTTLSAIVEKRLHPPVGERPMLWKELFAAESRRSGRLANVVSVLIALGLLGWCAWYLIRIMNQRTTIGIYPWQSDLQEEMNILLRLAGTTIAMLGLLAVAVRAATGFTTERERQTWDGLLVTPLEPREIVLGKVAGALWTGRWTAVLLALCWTMGIVAEALHPLAPVVMTVELAIYAFFFATVGARISLTARRSGRALAGVLSLGVFLGGGYLLCCTPFMIESHDGAWIFAASFPTVVGLSGFTAENLRELFSASNSSHRAELAGFAVATMIFLFLYLSAGVLALGNSIVEFNRIVGRPRQPLVGPSAGGPAVPPGGSSTSQGPPLGSSHEPPPFGLAGQS